MKRLYVLLAGLTLTPYFAFAANSSLQTFFKNLVGFINKTVIPFILGIAFLIFVINAVRYFVFQSGEEEGRENAKNLALYSVLAFVVIILFWGIVNLVNSSVGLSGKNAPTPDYLETNGTTLGGSRSTSGGTSGGSSQSGSSAGNSSGNTNDNPNTAVDPNCPNGLQGIGLDGTPCGIY
jgi:succinate dehydrogenase/fumarate reductase cytochrome b subunit